MFWSKAAYLKNMHSRGIYPQYSIMNVFLKRQASEFASKNHSVCIIYLLIVSPARSLKNTHSVTAYSSVPVGFLTSCRQGVSK